MLFYSSKKPIHLSIIHLNEVQKSETKRLNDALKSDNKTKCIGKLFKKLKNTNDEKPQTKTDDDKKGNVFVLDFNGDIKASGVERLREEISAVLSVANADDEVVVRLDSSGGQVHSYGLAAAELARIRTAGVRLTICVDKVAASGGYMMACVADKIIAAPFAIVGSIGVVSQMPNFHEFLKKHDIDVELFTAGEYKRTVTMFGKNDDDDRAKYQEDLNRIHELFKNHIKEYRPNLDIEKLATGEIWFGSDALGLGLIDELGTSDAYILEKLNNHNVLLLHSHQKPTVLEKLGLAEQAGSTVNAMIDVVKTQWTSFNQRANM